MRTTWPELPWRDWEPTVSTLHMWLQIVGKVRMALAPPLNHWWHVTLYVTSRGLTTSTIPYQDRYFQVDLDFIDHELRVADSERRTFTMALEAMSVATFYRDFMAGISGLGIDVRISRKPVEVADAIPFDEDEQHASYDPSHAELLWRGFAQADRVMKRFQSGFVGKASPVHIFWGSFDVATTRFSGRPAPLHADSGVPNCPPWVMEEAYSREETSVGWWPATDEPGPQFYAYTYPEPQGYKEAPTRPRGAYYNSRFGELTLPYDLVRQAADPDAFALEFMQSAYDVGAELAGWDRAALEPVTIPRTQPHSPWSVVKAATDAAPTTTNADTNRSRGWRPS